MNNIHPGVPPSLHPGCLSDFGPGLGPKGLGNLAQALAWVALFLRASPVRAPDNAGAIHIEPTQIQMTISSAPSGLVAFIVTPMFTAKMLPVVRHRRQSLGRWSCLVDRTTTGNKPRPDRWA
jgi:hypothetical protein